MYVCIRSECVSASSLFNDTKIGADSVFVIFSVANLANFFYPSGLIVSLPSPHIVSRMFVTPDRRHVPFLPFNG